MAIALAQLAKLPVYNGEYEAGIAVGIDPSLSSHEKLRLHRIPANLQSQSLEDVRKGCFTLVMWDLYNRHCVGKSGIAVQILMYGTYAGIQLGLISAPTEGGDTVFADLSNIDVNDAHDYFMAEINKTKLLNALSIGIATKAC